MCASVRAFWKKEWIDGRREQENYNDDQRYKKVSKKSFYMYDFLRTKY